MERGEENVSLIREEKEDDHKMKMGIRRRIWEESKKLWRIVGPAIFSRTVTYSTIVLTQAFAGHLGDIEFAAVSIANTVIVGCSFGLMLGMASALETLCGQAFGAKRYHMLGVYMQRSFVVLFLCALALLPIFLFATPILELIGQPPELAAMAGTVALYFIPLHFSFVFFFPLVRFFQCQLKNSITAYAAFISLVVHIFVSWLFIYELKLDLFGTALALDISWLVAVFGLFAYATCGGCPLTWRGFSMEAFSGLWDFFKLSIASGVMLCLENWYYRILLLMSGYMNNAAIAVDALSICVSINGWEFMIPLAYFAGTGVRVANELGGGNGKGARFASIVAVVQSIVIGVIFSAGILVLHDKYGYIFTSSVAVLEVVDSLSILLAFSILLNSLQPILSGVAVGSGWQAMVAYINIGSYYIIGIPLGIVLGSVFHLGVMGVWSGMIFGTTIQTIILSYITIRCDWDKEALMASTRMAKWDTLT